jgi:hypothetical protein
MVERDCPFGCVLFSWGDGEISHQISMGRFRNVVRACMVERFSTGHVDITWEEISPLRMGQVG